MEKIEIAISKKITSNIEESSKKISNIFDKFRLIFRLIFRRQPLNDQIQKRVKILGSLLDTDIIFDENIWSKANSLQILTNFQNQCFYSPEISLLKRTENLWVLLRNQF